MSITSTSLFSATPAPAIPPTNVRVPTKTLGQADFLKLLSVQLAQQDPTKPMDDTAFTAQMAQFTSLEQASQMSKDIKALRADSAMQSAAGIIGRQVTLNTKLGPVTGPVDSVDSSDGTVNVGVGGVYYPFSSVVHVAPAPVLAPTA